MIKDKDEAHPWPTSSLKNLNCIKVVRYNNQAPAQDSQLLLQSCCA